MLSRLFKKLLAVFLVWCGIAEAVQLFSRMFFGTWVAGDWFLILLASDGQELWDFIRLNPIPLLFASGVLIVFFAGAGGVLTLRRRAWRALVLGFAMYVLYGVLRWGALWSPAYLAYDTVRCFREYSELIGLGKWSEADERTACQAAEDPSTSRLPPVVLVIGESLTTTRMGIYGYPKDTTPGLSALTTNGLAVLPPRKVHSTFTAKALQELLMRNGDSLVKRMRRRGYRTVYLSAQRHWERYCGVGQMMFSACERRRYLGDESGDRGYSDLNLIPWINEELADTGRPLFLIVHLLGSHYPYADRYPSYWTRENNMDDYDMSVRMTDFVLTRTISGLPENAILVFTSDHGESPDSDSWRNGRDPAIYSVPMLVYPVSAVNHPIFKDMLIR